MKGFDQKGSLQISRDVIGAIAGVCAQEVKGVAGLSRRAPSFKQGFLQSPGGNKPVSVALRDDFVEINIGVALKYGAKISETCTDIQNRVKKNVQTMTGMAVSKVNVQVSKIVFSSERPEES